MGGARWSAARPSERRPIAAARKTGRVSVVFGAVGLVLAALLAVVDLRAALSVALLPSFLLSLGSRLVFAGRRPAVVWVLDLLGLVLMLAMVGSILERIADAR